MATSTRPEQSVAGSTRRRMESSDRPTAAAIIVLLLSIFTWWALSDGGNGAATLYGGTIVATLGLAVLAFRAPLRLTPGGPHLVAVAALGGLVIWTALSILWTSARDLALEDTARALSYLLAYAGGLWLAALLGRRLIFAVTPVVAAGAVAVAATIATVLLTGDPAEVLSAEGALTLPLGEPGANAACFSILALSCITLIARKRTGPTAAGALAALAGSSLSLVALSQSRSSTLALGVALVVCLALLDDRRRASIAALATLVPTALALPLLTKPGSAATSGSSQLVPLESAAFATIGVALLAAALAYGLVRTRAPGGRQGRDRDRGEGTNSPPRLAIAALAIAVGVGIALVAIVGASGWIVDESGDGSAGAAREDYRRVAVLGFEENKLIGGGAGSFPSLYAQERDSDQLVSSAGSIALDLGSELGIAGLVLLLLTLGAAVVAALRSCALGPEAATLTAVGVAAVAYLAVGGSLDPLWDYPAIVGPVLLLVGAAATPAATALSDLPGTVGRRWATGLAALAALAMVPLLLADRLTAAAVSGLPEDPEAALGDLELAATLNPFSDSPLVVEAEIAARAGDPVRAVEALEGAVDRQPLEWENHLLAAKQLANSDAAAASAELQRALELNPRLQGAEELERRLGIK